MSFQSPGIGSGLDVNSIVQQLVQAERAPTAQRINREQSRANSQISALAKLRGALEGLQSKLEGFSSGDGLMPRSTSSSHEDVLTATAANASATGDYAIEVEQLAAATRIRSQAFANDFGPLDQGEFVIANGDRTLTVTADGTTTSLDDVAAAINADAHIGVEARIVNGDAGAFLVLEGRDTGAANAVSVTTSGSGLLNGTSYDGDTSDSTGWTELSSARDSIAHIDGVTVSGSGNNISGAIEGVTISLAEARPGETVTLAVEQDSSALKKSVKDFVNACNAVIATIDEQTNFDVDAQTAAPLVGDAMTRGIGSTLRNDIAAEVSGASAVADTLVELGVTTRSDGHLNLDMADLDKVLAEDSRAVEKLFGGENGLASRISSSLAPYLDAEGMFDSRKQALDNKLDRVESQKNSLDLRMQRIEANYRAQFGALDKLVAQMNSTGAFLAQQLAGMPPAQSQ